jgi:hypothetical protein
MLATRSSYRALETPSESISYHRVPSQEAKTNCDPSKLEGWPKSSTTLSKPNVDILLQFGIEFAMIAVPLYFLALAIVAALLNKHPVGRDGGKFFNEILKSVS